MRKGGDEEDVEDLSEEEEEEAGDGGEDVGEPEEDVGEAEFEQEEFSGSDSAAALDVPLEWKEKAITVTRAVMAEFVITSIFMFIVTATAIQYVRASQEFNSSDINISNPTVAALSSGLIAVGVIYAFADVSGANFNPAVTFATVVTFKTSLLKGIFYICAQLLGSIFAALMIASCFPNGINTVRSVAVHPAKDVSIGQAFWIEVILTFIFVYVIFATAFDTVESGTKGKKMMKYSTSGETKSGYAPIAIGFTLGACVFCSGTISGGAFNPARVFGFAFVGDAWDHHWLYWIADCLGAGLAGYTQKIFSKPRATPPGITNLNELWKFLCLEHAEAHDRSLFHMLRQWGWG